MKLVKSIDHAITLLETGHKLYSPDKRRISKIDIHNDVYWSIKSATGKPTKRGLTEEKAKGFTYEEFTHDEIIKELHSEARFSEDVYARKYQRGEIGVLRYIQRMGIIKQMIRVFEDHAKQEALSKQQGTQETLF